MPLRRTGEPGRESHLCAMGLPVTVRCHGPFSAALHQAVEEAWTDCRAEASADAVVLDCLVDPEPSTVQAARADGMVAERSVDVLLDRLSPAITTAAIGAHTGKLLMMHACAMADRETGCAVALVAASGTGKTTLARTLGDELDYVTDETVAVRRDGTLVPYPKPLSILESPTAGFKRQVAASSLGLHPVGEQRVGLARLLVLEREPGRQRVDAEPVPTLQALATLAQQVSQLGTLERPLHLVAGFLHATGGLLHVRYGEAETLRGLVHELVAA